MIETTAVLIPAPEESGPRAHRFLAVRRPEDDEDLPGAWGLPATTVQSGESPGDAALRVGREKLGVELTVVRELARGTRDRPAGRLRMRLFEARVGAGDLAVPQAHGDGTQYVEWRWSRPERLKESARRGSLCSRLYLRHLNERW